MEHVRYLELLNRETPHYESMEAALAAEARASITQLEAEVLKVNAILIERDELNGQRKAQAREIIRQLETQIGNLEQPGDQTVRGR